MLKKGKQVEIICGKDKGKKGEIIEIIKKINKVKVKGINFIKKHEKTTKEKKGGIISKENFIDISNIKILDSADKKTKLVIVANPNSPTGTVMSEKNIKKILNKAKKNNSHVLVDECDYGYYKKSVIGLLSKYNNT